MEENFDDHRDDLLGVVENLQFLAVVYPPFFDSTDAESDEDESFVAGMWWTFSNNEDQEFPPSVYRTPMLSAAVELFP